MAYAHPHKVDVFLSYAWLDNSDGTIDRLQADIESHLRNTKPANFHGTHAVFRDESTIERAGDIDKQVAIAIHNTAVFVAVLSDEYFRRPWCVSELATRLKPRFADRSETVMILWLGGARSDTLLRQHFPNLVTRFQYTQNQLPILFTDLSRELDRLRQKPSVAPRIYLAPPDDSCEERVQSMAKVFEREGICSMIGDKNISEHDLRRHLGRSDLFLQMVTRSPCAEGERQRAFALANLHRNHPQFVHLETARPAPPNRPLHLECMIWALNASEARQCNDVRPEVLQQWEAEEIAIDRARTIHWQVRHPNVQDAVLIACEIDFEALIRASSWLARGMKTYYTVWENPWSGKVDSQLTRLLCDRYTKDVRVRKLLFLYEHSASEEFSDWVMGMDLIIKDEEKLAQHIKLNPAGMPCGIVWVDPPPKAPLSRGIGMTILEANEQVVTNFV